MKKIAIAAFALLFATCLFGGCGGKGNNEENSTLPPVNDSQTDDEKPGNDDEKDPVDGDNGSQTDDEKPGNDDEQNPTDGGEDETNPPVDENKPDFSHEYAVETPDLSAGGYVKNKISDFSVYEGTDAYRVVTTPSQLLQAIADAKCHYTNTWYDEYSDYIQQPAEGYTEQTMWGGVRVIEIANDLNLGYNLIRNDPNISVVNDFSASGKANISKFTMSDMFNENGISQIKVENTSNLLIYSKNGAKITHAGFKLTSVNNVVFRNLEFDEMWQWEDASSDTTGAVGDYDAFGWAYFKIGFSGYVWIDHCTFGKSYDGQIDYSNPVYNANAGTAFRAPLGADGNNGLHISNCKFNAGSDDEDGYLYKMMQKIEEDYQNNGGNYLYYKALRDGGFSFDEILYGIAIPQKKGFLCGDDAKFSGSYDDATDYNFNLKLQVSFENCLFKNLEDRIPKLRGGNAYVYNCVVDCSQYIIYRDILKNGGAVGYVQAVNSGWKCGLVSQCILCGNGGSVMAENCIFKGVDSLLKNNDSKNGGVYLQGGFNLKNCSYQKYDTDTPIVGSTDDDVVFPNATTARLRTMWFKWHTPDNEAPFTIEGIPLEDLENTLATGSGVFVEKNK